MIIAEKHFLRDLKRNTDKTVGGPEVIYIKNNFIRYRLEELKWANYKKWLKNQPVLNLVVCKYSFIQLLFKY